MTALASGGCMMLLSETERRDSVALIDLMNEHRVERLFLPFVGLQQMAATAEATGIFPRDLREIITAGEALQVTPPLIALQTKLPELRIHNHYGPSETHVVTAYSLSADARTWPPLPPIGFAIANTQIYLLDESMQPVPVNVPGELFIGGDMLARGYIGRPDLTAERFIPDPIAANGGRLYRTGDLARYREDGAIEFLGRIDHQVKIRGFRVELGEIEAMLTRNPAVKDATVISFEAGTGDKRLAAYVVAVEGTTPTSADLRTFLGERLPDYMVPAIFIPLERLPQTPSGKVDRRSLPAPDAARLDSGVDFVAPRGPVEEKVAAIWRDILRVPQVGVHHNFFELGGHSLLATRVVSAVRDAFQVEMPLRTVFEEPTVAGLALAITRLLAAREGEDQLAELIAQVRQLSADDLQTILAASEAAAGPRT